MKQIVQSYSDGQLRVEEVPAPVCRAGGVLVRVRYSLVSAGTERMKVTQARMNLVQKARARPDKVRQVVDSVRQVGVTETWNKVRERLDALTPLGYSVAGEVVEVGAGVDDYHVGDRVACAGEGIACHAEYVFVPRNLCAPVPAGVDLRDACCATVGAIAMNGVRQAGVTLGDSVLVVGLGLVGLLGVQILRAAGCRVIGVDLDPQKVAMAERCGAAAYVASEPGLEDEIRRRTCGVGPDAAYIAASTESDAPMELAGNVLRDRGTVAIVGMVPIRADWRTYYMKELQVVMSRSYGPGRYDATYEAKGIDYPIGYVPWTLQRNLAAFLRLIADGAVRPALLEPSIFPLEQAPEAYRQLRESRDHATGLIFEYAASGTPTRVVSRDRDRVPRASGRAVIGMIGAGNFATGTLIPALKRADRATLRAICSARGLSAASAARRHEFGYAASDYRDLLADDRINAIVIATRHNTHAALAAAALRAGKHVFVEKPLAMSATELDDLLAAEAESGGAILMPGFNRRFSPLSAATREFFSGSGPVQALCRVNAGPLGQDSWYADAEQGGWRIVSEGCHFVDLLQYVCGGEVARVHAALPRGHVRDGQHDNCTVTLELTNGSLATLMYVADGDPRLAKERVEIFGHGKSAVIDNFRTLTLWAGDGRRPRTQRGSGKGHAEELAAFVDAVATGGTSPLPLRDAVVTTRTTFAILAALQAGAPQVVSMAVDELVRRRGTERHEEAVT